MIHLKLTIAYDGTGLVGWQRQAAGTSVQALIEEALAPLEGGPVVVAGAGRTDAGVHAMGQVASVTLQRDIAPRTVVRAANMQLPPAVRVLAAEEVGPEFHARFRATAKTYRYRIWNGDVVSPFERSFAWHVPWPTLNLAAMDAAAARLVGTHDFAAFQGSGSDTQTTVRTIFASSIVGRAEGTSDPVIAYDARADGFLRHMVRAIVGSLVDVGRGRKPAAWMSEVLESRERGRVGQTAPATGLFLVGVEYE